MLDNSSHTVNGTCRKTGEENDLCDKTDCCDLNAENYKQYTEQQRGPLGDTLSQEPLNYEDRRQDRTAGEQCRTDGSEKTKWF